MRKSLLFASLTVAFAASAAVEVGFTDSEALGLANKPVLEDNTVLATSENATMYFLYGQETSAQNPAFNGFKQIIVNGETVDLVGGIGGSANGVANLVDGPSSGGCIYSIVPKKAGYMIVCSKISSNKNFYVFAGMVGEDPVPMAYTLGMDIQSADYPDVHNVIYSLPAGELGDLDMEAANIDDYTFGGTTIAWPIRIGTKNAEAESAGNGTGVMIFPVEADLPYLVFATGSKMNTCGYVFVESTEVPSVGLIYGRHDGDDGYNAAVTNIAVTGEPFAGINNIAVDNKVVDENAPVYNIYGQRVSKDTKGLLIQNGVKFYNR